MPILNYTTSVAAEKSAAEVASKLVKAGASQIGTRYSDGQPIGINFVVETAYGPRAYSLPADHEGVYRALCSGKNRAEARYRTREQAQRVAWRILKDWVEAQLAIIESGMVRLDEVMLPYMLNGDGRTVVDMYREREGQMMLEAAQ